MLSHADYLHVLGPAVGRVDPNLPPRTQINLRPASERGLILDVKSRRSGMTCTIPAVFDEEVLFVWVARGDGRVVVAFLEQELRRAAARVQQGLLAGARVGLKKLRQKGLDGDLTAWSQRSAWASATGLWMITDDGLDWHTAADLLGVEGDPESWWVWAVQNVELIAAARSLLMQARRRAGSA